MRLISLSTYRKYNILFYSLQCFHLLLFVRQPYTNIKIFLTMRAMYNFSLGLSKSSVKYMFSHMKGLTISTLIPSAFIIL